MGGREPDRQLQGPRDDGRGRRRRSRRACEAVVCASTGNTAASAAAYAARAGLPALILQPAGAVALGKLAQARALGARVLEVRGSFDEALTAARELAARGTHVLVNSLNPYRIEGQKTAAFEIVEELGVRRTCSRSRTAAAATRARTLKGFDEAGCGHAADAARRGGRARDDGRVGDPHRGPGRTRRKSSRRWSARAARSSPLDDDAILEAWRRSPTRRASSASPPPLRGRRGARRGRGRRATASSASSPATG